MPTMTRVTKIGVALSLLLIVAFSSRNISASPLPQAETPTPTAVTCDTQVLGQVTGDSAVYYAPDDSSTTKITLGQGTSFFVCTNIHIPGWAGFLLTSNGQVLYAKAETFAGVPGLELAPPDVATSADLSSGTGAIKQTVRNTSNLGTPTEESAPVGDSGSGGIPTYSGTCATSAILRVVETNNVYFAPSDTARTQLTVTAGTSFPVCTDIDVQGWTAFEIYSGNGILFVPAGTFAQ